MRFITKYRAKYISPVSAEMSRDSGVAPVYGLDDRGFESRQGLGIFLFTTASRSALGTIQPPIQ
jgi:hypothetical protein